MWLAVVAVLHHLIALLPQSLKCAVVFLASQMLVLQTVSFVMGHLLAAYYVQAVKIAHNVIIRLTSSLLVLRMHLIMPAHASLVSIWLQDFA